MVSIISNIARAKCILAQKNVRTFALHRSNSSNAGSAQKGGRESRAIAEQVLLREPKRHGKNAGLM